MLAEIEELTNPRCAPAKALSAEQQNLKGLMLGQLDRVRDESDQQQPVRLVFEPKSSRQDPDEFITLLLAQTSLEGNVPMNLVMLGLDGRPRQKDLKSILSEWLDFRMHTVTRRLSHRLDKVNQRPHPGRPHDGVPAYRGCDPRHSRIRRAQARADAPLWPERHPGRRHSGHPPAPAGAAGRLQAGKELDALRGEARTLRHLLDDESARRDLMAEEIRADAARYGDARRTEVKPAEKAVLTQTVADEPVTLIVSRNGWIRAQRHNVDVSALNFKDGDALGQVVETRTIHPVVALDSRGRSYTLACSDVPTGRGDGVPLSSLIDIQDKARVVAVLSAKDDSRYLVASSGGYGFIAQLKDMVSRVKAGKAFLTVEDQESALPPVPAPDHASAHVLVVSQQARLLAFALDELKKWAVAVACNCWRWTTATRWRRWAW